MDRLTQESIAAQKAGLSYGMWKAMQPRTEAVMPAVDDLEEQENVKKCVICGKAIPIKKIGSGGSNRRTCSEECSYKRHRERCRAYYHRRVLRMRAGDLG